MAKSKLALFGGPKAVKSDPKDTLKWPIKLYKSAIIRQHANAFRKVAENYRELLKDDPGNTQTLEGRHFFAHSEATVERKIGTHQSQAGKRRRPIANGRE